MKYEGGENLELIKYRRIARILTPISVILFLLCTLFVVGIVLMAQEQSKLISEKNRYKTAIEKIANGVATGTISDLFKEKSADSLVTQEEVKKGEIPDHFRGKKDAKVIAIEYADYACAHCQSLAPEFAKIYSDYSDRVLFIYRNFNLNFANSAITRNAAEAAFLLGGEEKFWAMNELLYSDKTWIGNAVDEKQAEEKLKNFAKKIGLDPAKYWQTVQEADTNAIATKTAHDKEAGAKHGVRGTPTWIIDEKTISGGPDKIREALDAALEK